MAHLLEPFSPPPNLRSLLITNPPTTVPSVQDLVTLEEELKTLQVKTEKRVKKAETDLRLLDAARRKLKDKDREPKASLKREPSASIKREHHGSPDVEDFVPSSRVGSQPRGFPPPTKPKLGDMVKKKKRKFDADSDGEGRAFKVAKPSPAPSLDPKKQQLKPPVALPQRVTTNGYRIAEDFSEPSTSTLPARPVPLPLPIPGPRKPTDVVDDFSKCKPPTQTSITTFYTSVEPWLRPIREDELGLVQYDGDSLEPFLIPPLGRHYSEAWDEEDRLIYGHPLSSSVTAPHVEQTVAERLAHNSHWEPSALKDDELSTDERSVGPVTERLVAALLLNNSDKPPDQGKEEGSSKSAKQPVLNVMDLEERVKTELVAAGLFADEEPDYSASEDQILAELRRCQRALRDQMNVNKARRQRVFSIAQDRLAYQEYVETREVLDRQISSIYSRLQKRDSVKSASAKKRKRPGSAAMLEEEKKEKPLPPAALGLGPDPSGKLVVNEQLKQAVDLRRRWVDQVGGTLGKLQEQHPGRLWGLPSKSIYEYLDEDIKALEHEKEKNENG